MKSLKYKIPYLLLLTTSFVPFCHGVDSSSPDMCSQKMLFSYFPKEYVSKTLEKYHVPKEKWSAIQKDLDEKDSQIVKIVEEKATKKDPNLLHDMTRRKEVAAIFQKTLMEILTEVLAKNGISDQKQIEEMLKDIQKQKIEQFKGCLKKLEE